MKSPLGSPPPWWSEPFGSWLEARMPAIEAKVNVIKAFLARKEEAAPPWVKAQIADVRLMFSKEEDVKKPWPKMFLVVIGILFLASLAGTEVYRGLKLWRAHSLVSAAENTNGQADAAIEAKVHAAFHLEPNDPYVVRTCARYEVAVGNPYGLVLYQRLALLPGASRDDQREATLAFILAGETSWAEPLLDILMQNPTADDLAVVAQYHWRQQEMSQAIDLLRKAVALDPANRSHQLLLAQMLAFSKDAKERDEALQLLQKLAETKDAAGLQALITLSQNRNFEVELRRNVLKQLREHPLLDDPARFAAWDLEAHLGDRDPKVVLQEAVDFFKKAELPRKTAAAQWILYTEEQPELALQLTPVSDANASQKLLLVRLDALGDLQQWAQVDKELAVPSVPLPEALVDIYRGRAAQQSNQATLSPFYWDRARQAAATDRAMLLQMVNFALKQNLFDEAKKTYQQLTKVTGSAHEGYVALLQLEAQHGTQAELLQTLKDMRDALPADPQPQNDWAFLSLLLNTNVDEALKIAQKLVQTHPDVLAYRSTLALAYVRKNNPAAADAVYNGIDFDWATTPDSWKLIRVVAWAADGQQPMAHAYADKINRALLRPEEQTIFDTYVGTPANP